MKLITQAGASQQRASELSSERPSERLQDGLSAALLFCLTTFVISSIRASLNPDNDFELFDGKRIALIIAGAGVFWLAIRSADMRLPDMRTLGRIALVALPGLAGLFALAVAWDVLIEQRFDNVPERNLRWILLWSGYFGTGLAAWLALQYGAALSHAQARQGLASIRPTTDAQDPSAHEGFWVKTGRQTVRIAREDVEWIEAEGNYVRIHSRDAAHGLVRMTLAAITRELGGDQFVRIHRSALCRRAAIRGYRRKSSGAMLALLASGAEAPLGRSYAKSLLEPSRGTDIAGLEPFTSAADETVTSAEPEVQTG